ncbi:TPA: hypothetical protein ACF334_004475 [Vibrio parahaemolyticus]
MFDSIDQAKEHAQKFKKGTIVPNRVLKTINPKEKWKKHWIKWGFDAHVVQCNSGNMLCIVDESQPEFDSVIHLDWPVATIVNYNKMSMPDLKGNPYGNGMLVLYGNNGLTEQEYLAKLNHQVFG